MTTTHTGGGYSVTINDDGSILVKQGDWISKYSMAIHGDLTHLYEYMRKHGTGFKPITNVDLIQAGETIYHEPSIPNGGTPVGAPVGSPILPKLPNGQYDVDEIIREAGLPPSSEDALQWALNRTRRGQAVGSFIGIFVANGTLPWLFGANAFAGPILGTIASVYALWKARNYGIKQAGMRGTSYGAVAWAFDDPVPRFPEAMRKSLEKGGRASDIPYYESTWQSAVSQSQQKLNSYCSQENFDKEAVKTVFMARSLMYGGGAKEPRSEWLAAALLLDTAKTYYTNELDRKFFLSPWSWYPNDRYVGRPSYPPKIDSRYPF